MLVSSIHSLKNLVIQSLSFDALTNLLKKEQNMCTVTHTDIKQGTVKILDSSNFIRIENSWQSATIKVKSYCHKESTSLEGTSKNYPKSQSVSIFLRQSQIDMKYNGK